MEGTDSVLLDDEGNAYRFHDHNGRLDIIHLDATPTEVVMFYVSPCPGSGYDLMRVSTEYASKITAAAEAIWERFKVATEAPHLMGVIREVAEEHEVKKEDLCQWLMLRGMSAVADQVMRRGI